MQIRSSGGDDDMENGIFHVTLTNQGERVSGQAMTKMTIFDGRWTFCASGAARSSMWYVVENRNSNNGGQWRGRGEGKGRVSVSE